MADAEKKAEGGSAAAPAAGTPNSKQELVSWGALGRGALGSLGGRHAVPHAAAATGSASRSGRGTAPGLTTRR